MNKTEFESKLSDYVRGVVRQDLLQVAMLVFCLLAFLASTAHAAQEPMAARTRVAIGLAPLQPGIGLWLIRPKTWVGVEFNALEWSWDQLEYYGDFVVDEDQRFLSFNVRGSLTIQRTLSKGPLYKSCYFAFNHISRQTEGLARTTGGGGSFEFGFGIHFQPWKKMVVSLRQGVAWEMYENWAYEAPWWEWNSSLMDSTTDSIRLQKPRLWVLIHF